jgi:iron complex outermembrane receptor protein
MKIAQGRKACAAAALALFALRAPAQQPALVELVDLGLEELGRIPVVSVTGRPQPVQEAAAAVFVITADDIRRSAATSLPEALRLAPMLQVARIDATQYAISARGFNNAIGNKLLVMIDGRTVYSPLFSGVFWDAQDVLLEDVERIEVISGAGATLWGANAVNGVINVITRPAQDTQGLLAVARAGTTGNEAALRWGGRFDGGGWRVYAKQADAAATTGTTGASMADHQDRQQAGFRTDWARAEDRLTLQGDLYQAGGDGTLPTQAELSGANLLARWRREHPDGSNWQLQAWFDQASRDDSIEFHDHERTVDVRFDHVPALGAGQQLIWGVGYRRAVDQTRPTPLVVFDPAVKVLHWVDAFVQDELHLGDRLRVTAGAKVEGNAYTGAEFLPTLRAAVELGDAGTLWASASRAVRAPARLDRDFHFPGTQPYLIDGGPSFRSEIARVYEIGLRGRQSDAGVGYTVTAFHDEYSRLRAGRDAPTTIDNLAWGDISGVELTGSLDVTRGWRLAAGWVELREALRAAPDAGPRSVANLGDDPHRQWSLRSTARLDARIDLDVALRHVGALPDPAVPAYTVADLRIGWNLRPGLTLSLLAQDLDRRHVEFDPASSTRFGPRAFAKLEWRGY